MTGVFGPSGAGKTTLVNLIAGLDRPDRGSISITSQPVDHSGRPPDDPADRKGDEQTLFDSKRRIDLPPHRRRLGVIFQEHRLFPHLSVRGNLVFGRPSACHHDAEVRTIIELLELAPLLDRRVTGLSGGERQRVAIGRAVLSRPRALLLDEPLASLDMRLRREIIEHLQRIHDLSSIPMVYVSHNLDEVLQLTDRLIVLERGRLVGHGRYSELVHDPGAQQVLRSRGMCNLLVATLLRHEPLEGVSVVQIGQASDPRRRLIVPRLEAAEGRRVLLSIDPRDIALALEPVQRVSIRNQVPAVVQRCTVHDQGALVAVEVGAESGALLVEVSRMSVAALRIAAGQPVVCLIKCSAIRRQWR